MTQIKLTERDAGFEPLVWLAQQPLASHSSQPFFENEDQVSCPRLFLFAFPREQEPRLVSVGALFLPHVVCIVVPFGLLPRLLHLRLR